MKTIKELMQIITKEFGELFGAEIRDIRLEEYTSTNEMYYLTVSFLLPNENQPLGSLGKAISSPYIRQYKEVRANGETGEIISVKIHKDA